MALAARKRNVTSPSPRDATRLVESLEGRTLLTAVYGFSVVNADTDRVVMSLPNGGTIDYAKLGTSNIDIVANADGTTGSVRIALDDSSVIDSTRPFSLTGVTGGTDYAGFTPAPGTHTLSAIPYANTNGGGAAGTKKQISFTVADSGGDGPTTAAVNQKPTVTLSNTSTSTTAPATIRLAAAASDADGTVRRVEFYRGTTKLGQDTTAPYTWSIFNVPVGTYTYTAKVVDNVGAATTSAPLSVSVTRAGANQAPTVTLANTSASTVAPATINLQASAADNDGTVSRVDFYRGTTKLGQDTTAPYTLAINSVSPGTYTYTAKAIDNKGAVGTSAPLQVTITSQPQNQVPTVSLSNTSASTVAPATVQLLADAADADGSVASVEFYQGGVLLGSDATAPYQFSVSNVAAGTYTYTAKAIDNVGGTATSSPLTVTVTSPPVSNAAPFVALVNPVSGKFAAPGFFALRADASDSDGTITRVDFLSNGTLIKSTDAAPYLVSWQDVPLGIHRVTAVAYDNAGGVSTSAVSTVEVANPTTGRPIYVSTAGVDGGNGASPGAPLRTISAAAKIAGPGDTVWITGGTYTESVVVPNGGTSDAPIRFQPIPGTGAVIVDAPVDPFLGTRAASLFVPASDPVDFIWVSGITFRNAGNLSGGHNSAVRTQDGWRVVDCTVETSSGSGIGIFGDRVVVQRVTAQGNGVSGITSSSTDDSLLLDSVTRNNNYLINTTEGGGGKMTRANGLLVERLQAYGNKGPGFWFDINNINSVVRDSEFHDNLTDSRIDANGATKTVDGRGLFFEISGLKVSSGVVTATGVLLAEGNRAFNNAGPGITIYATSYAHLRGNTIENDSLELKDGGRQPYRNQHLTIQHNFFRNARIIADGASSTDPNGRGYQFDHNTFDNNDDRIYKWNGADLTLAGVRSVLGFELFGVSY